MYWKSMGFLSTRGGQWTLLATTRLVRGKIAHALYGQFSIFTAIFIDFKGIPNIFPQKSGERIGDT